MFLRKPDKSKLKDIILDEFEIQLMELVRKHWQPERLSEEARKGCDSPNTPTKGSESSRND